ncbi:hypothetical protein DD237_000060 [Peronospora effusa]|uniref:Uncharacterized protein n=1 Tax=Peronospora effusa TaxID=542832 RepID=A0A3R7W8D2_9STRA|nr:hypothetical protein DD237_000060 [Peronospora effusa]
MLVRVQKWSDADVLALLSLLRKHLLYYVYTCDNTFVTEMHAELRDKPVSEIQEMVRSLMLQFALGLSTKNFRTDVIMTNGQNVYVYEHLYESISQLAENKIGGIWLPNELNRFLQKARQYRGLFLENQEMYFKRIQVWSEYSLASESDERMKSLPCIGTGKSVAETKSKFYALRDIYVRESKRRLCRECACNSNFIVIQRQGVELARLELLKKIFSNVPPAHRTNKTAVSTKTLKLWSSEEMEKLVDFVVQITAQIQSTGSSDLVNHVAEALHRTDGSCVTKLIDMREKFLKKMPTVRAANLPDIIFDPTSDANKIFSAGKSTEPTWLQIFHVLTSHYVYQDWSNSNDPYALGYLAMKSRSLSMTAARNKYKKRRVIDAWSPRPKLRSSTLAARGKSSSKANPMSPLALDVAPLKRGRPVGKVQRTASTPRAGEPYTKERAAVMGSLPVEITPVNALPVSDYAAFVQDIAEQCQWTEKAVHNVLRCMQQSIDLYRSNRLVTFFYKVASLTSGSNCRIDWNVLSVMFGIWIVLGVTFQDLFPDVQLILTQFERRFGSLDNFENFVQRLLDMNSFRTTEQEANDREDKLDCDRSTTVCTQSNVAKEKAIELRRLVDDGDERDHDRFPRTYHVQQTARIGNKDTVVKEDEHERGKEGLSLLASLSQTSRTGVEDTAEEHTLSTVGKQSSPGMLTLWLRCILYHRFTIKNVHYWFAEDTWDEGVDADVELDNQSVNSSENACA